MPTPHHCPPRTHPHNCALHVRKHTCSSSPLCAQRRWLTAQGMSVLAWAYARLGFLPRSVHLPQVLARQACYRARRLRGRGLANLMWALARWRWVGGGRSVT